MTDPNRPPTEGVAQPASTDPTPTPTQPAPATPEAEPDPLRGSRTSGAWAMVVALGLVLLLLIVFIAQNTQQVDVSFLGWTGQTPLAVALLIAAVAGLALTAVAGSLRILQLRRRVRRDAKR
jgi:uncharacterized integral membrane protein